MTVKITLKSKESEESPKHKVIDDVYLIHKMSNQTLFARHPGRDIFIPNKDYTKMEVTL